MLVSPQVPSKSFSTSAMLLQVPATRTPNISSFPTLTHFNVPYSVVVAVEETEVVADVLADEVADVGAVLLAVEVAVVVTVVSAEEVAVLVAVEVAVVAAEEETEVVAVVLTDDVAEEEAVLVCVVEGDVTSHSVMVPASLWARAAFRIAAGAAHPRSVSVNNKSPEHEKVPFL